MFLRNKDIDFFCTDYFLMNLLDYYPVCYFIFDSSKLKLFLDGSEGLYSDWLFSVNFSSSTSYLGNNKVS